MLFQKKLFIDRITYMISTPYTSKLCLKLYVHFCTKSMESQYSKLKMSRLSYDRGL